MSVQPLSSHTPFELSHSHVSTGCKHPFESVISLLMICRRVPLNGMVKTTGSEALEPLTRSISTVGPINVPESAAGGRGGTTIQPFKIKRGSDTVNCEQRLD